MGASGNAGPNQYDLNLGVVGVVHVCFGSMFALVGPSLLQVSTFCSLISAHVYIHVSEHASASILYPVVLVLLEPGAPTMPTGPPLPLPLGSLQGKKTKKETTS